MPIDETVVAAEDTVIEVVVAAPVEEVVAAQEELPGVTVSEAADETLEPLDETVDKAVAINGEQAAEIAALKAGALVQAEAMNEVKSAVIQVVQIAELRFDALERRVSALEGVKQGVDGLPADAETRIMKLEQHLRLR